MKKIITFVVCCFIGCLNVSASENNSYVEYQYIDNVYSNRQLEGDLYTGPQGIIYVNDKIAYCLNPELNLTSKTYTQSEDFSTLNINQNTLNHLELVSYFGYGYNERTSPYYYLATQEIIWEYISNSEVFWTNGEDGEIINIDDYKNDIINSVNNYLLKPRIPTYAETYQGEDIILKDKYNVLKYYESSLWLGEIIDNTLKLSAEYKGTIDIILSRKPLNYETSYIYLSEGSQALATFGYSGKLNDIMKITYKVKTLSQLSLVKKDIYQDKIIKNKETKVKIYDVTREEYIIENGSDIFTIGETGVLQTEVYLEEGEYRIEEIEAPDGYKKMTEPLNFSIYIHDGPITEVVTYNEPLLYDIYISKFKEEYVGLSKSEEAVKGTYMTLGAYDVSYGIFASEDIFDIEGNILYKKDTLVAQIDIYDGAGMAYDIPYGNYYLKEIKCEEEYILDSTVIDLPLTDENTFITFNFVNSMKKGNITIHKVDEGEGLKGAKFILFGDKYLEQTTLESDELGYIILEDVPYDTYHLKEIEAPEGYKIDEEEKTLTLSEVELKYEFPNEKVLIEEPVTPIEPEIPEEPEEPATPIEPEIPEEPENSIEPEIPEEPEEPENSIEPEIPEEPEEPETSIEPEIPEEPEEPETPIEPEIPEVSEEPEISSNPEEEMIIPIEKNNEVDKYVDMVVENPNTGINACNNNFFNIMLYISFLFGIHKYYKKI